MIYDKQNIYGRNLTPLTDKNGELILKLYSYNDTRRVNDYNVHLR